MLHTDGKYTCDCELKTGRTCGKVASLETKTDVNGVIFLHWCTSHRDRAYEGTLPQYPRVFSRELPTNPPTQADVDAAIDRLIDEAVKLEELRGRCVHESKAYWFFHDAAVRVHNAAACLMPKGGA